MDRVLPAFPAPLEVWGGIEGTVNRVGDRYFDQLERNGHARRVADLDLFAAIGIRAIRYPVLWERVAPDGLDRADWRWPDERLGRLRELGLRPIVGLIHHGSGPRDTSLLDPAFPERLAHYAGAVARRYPWVADYTPVNEPLTTARFSALYGHWYPHARDDASFARALLNQCRAVVLAMEAIRDVNPAARLVQTDDLGKTYATPTLAYQAEFENERRWISFDLIAGRLSPDRPMWEWLRSVGATEAELEWFLAHPCPPDILGINHYLSSERFLDDRLDRYPGEFPGTNGSHRYVDVLAARVLPHGVAGPERLLREAWERYGLPLAITEAHNSGHREEQIRWLDEVWRGAQRAKTDGVDVRALTVWSLLGAYDWHCLVTRDEAFYEPGVFDVRHGDPRPTAIARMVADLATHGRYEHPVLAAPGWWRRPDRLIREEDGANDGDAFTPPHVDSGTIVAPLLVLADDAPLGTAFTAACRGRYLARATIERGRAQLAHPAQAELALWADAPWAVVDLAPVLPGESERQQELRLVLAGLCARRETPLLVFSLPRAGGRPSGSRIGRDEGVPAVGERRSNHHREAQLLREHPAALVVRIDQPADDDATSPDQAIAAVINEALDLLMDGGSGVWEAAPQATGHWPGLSPVLSFAPPADSDRGLAAPMRPVRRHEVAVDIAAAD